MPVSLAVERWALNVDLDVNAANPQLVEFIRAKIAREGPVSFAWFMERALYHPQLGYYSSGRAELGRHGDYFTNVSVGPVFGKLLALQFNQVWQELGRPSELIVVEQGAHDGVLAADVLTALETDAPACFAAVRYRIIEPFPMLRERQMGSLSKLADRVEWFESPETIEDFIGIHFSNELADAMPVHLVRRAEGRGPNQSPEWLEKFVDWHNDRFVFVEHPVSDARLRAELKTFPLLPAGFEMEINLVVLDWIELLSRKLSRGYVVIFDYGFTKQELSALRHRAGTLQCRVKHQLLDSPFDCVGNCDITAHVYWTGLAEKAQNQNLDIAGFTDQHHFLTGIMSEHPDLVRPNDHKMRRQLQTLLHPEMMGRTFQALALSRGIGSDVTLSGFKFARPARQQLGIG